MGWKKPKWVQNLQSGAQNVADKIGDTVRDTVKPAAKSTFTLENVSKALNQFGGWVGNKFNDIVAPDTANRKPTVKIQGPNPLAQDRDMKQPMKDFGPTPGEKKAFEGLTPILQNTPIDNVSIPVIDNIRKVLASGGSGVLALPDSPDEEEPITRKQASDKVAAAGDIIDPQTLARVRANLQKAKDKVIETGKAAGEAVRDTFVQGTDSLPVRTFWFRFGNVATKQEIDAYRKAEAAGNKAEMDRLNRQMEARQKKGSK